MSLGVDPREDLDPALSYAIDPTGKAAVLSGKMAHLVREHRQVDVFKRIPIIATVPAGFAAQHPCANPVKGQAMALLTASLCSG